MGCLWTKDSLLFLPSFARPLLLLSRLVSCSLSASISKARRVIQSAFLSLTLSFYRFVKRSFASEKETTAHVPRFNAFFYFKLKQQISTRPSHHHRDAGSELFFDPFSKRERKWRSQVLHQNSHLLSPAGPDVNMNEVWSFISSNIGWFYLQQP